MAVKTKYIRGHPYRYETHTVWNKDEKRYQTKWTYIGAVDEKTGAIREKRIRGLPTQPENLILDYGDTFAINDFVERSGMKNLVDGAFGKLANTIFALSYYKLLESSPMIHARTWFSGNYVSRIFPDVNLSSQRISEFLKSLGSEKLFRDFFRAYLSEINCESGVVIDSTGLPNDCSLPITAPGHHGGDVENEIRLLMVVNKENAQPLYFRCLPGNIVDVSTLETTVKELAAFNVTTKLALVDAGYNSDTNIRLLYEKGIAFLTRLPANRKLFAEEISATAQTIENVKNFVAYGRRGLFIERCGVTLCGEFKGYAYVCLDLERQANEKNKIMRQSLEEKPGDVRAELDRAGKFVLVSSIPLEINEVLPFYYLRQSAEQIFKISKSYADVLPLRIQSEAAFRGLMMLNFISVLLHINFSKRLPRNHTFDSAVKELRNLKCKVYDSGNCIPMELNKKQKEIVSALAHTVGNWSGD